MHAVARSPPRILAFSRAQSTDNAIKFTAEGTVVLSFGYAPTGIADVEALVRHQGPGEPPVSEQAVVFHARHQPVNHVVRLGVLAPILDRLLGLLVGGQSWPRSRQAVPRLLRCTNSPSLVGCPHS